MLRQGGFWVWVEYGTYASELYCFSVDLVTGFVCQRELFCGLNDTGREIGATHIGRVCLHIGCVLIVEFRALSILGNIVNDAAVVAF